MAVRAVSPRHEGHPLPDLAVMPAVEHLADPALGDAQAPSTTRLRGAAGTATTTRAVDVACETGRDEPQGRAEAAAPPQCYEGHRKMAANETGNHARKPEGVSGLHNLRTALRARVKSKPEVEGQVHLDMYRLTRQRVMWVRLQQQAAQNLGTIQGELKRSLGKLKAEIATEDGAPASGAPEDKSAERYGDFRVRF